jgi:protein-tyrosine phosphatase
VIDLHCHILPALDDGALDVEDSLAMGRQADADGITIVCATPHIRHDHDVRIGELGSRVAALNTAFARHDVAARVVTGGEVAEQAVPGLDRDELTAVSIGGAGRWILLEPHPGPLSESLLRAIEVLSGTGFRALVAHPERHLGPGSAELLASAVADGALVQATAEDLVEPGSRLLAALASRGLVHVLGSDAHSSRIGRPVRLSTGLRALETVPALAPHVSWIAQIAPEAILRGDDVEAPYAVT